MLNSKEAIRFSVSKPISHFSLTFFADDSMAWTLWGVPGGLHGRCFWCTRRSTEPFNNIGSSRRGRRVYHYGLLQHKNKNQGKIILQSTQHFPLYQSERWRRGECTGGNHYSCFQIALPERLVRRFLTYNKLELLHLRAQLLGARFADFMASALA